jgi:hypothetical protein
VYSVEATTPAPILDADTTHPHDARWNRGAHPWKPTDGRF